MLAICQVADTGPLESLAVMLRAISIEPVLPNRAIRDRLRAIGCDTVLEISDLVRSWGYEQPFEMAEAGLNDMRRRDVIYVDVKAHRSYAKVVKEWTNLEGRVLWYRINGGKPEHVINERGDHGDEVNPPCPVLTPNQWYHEQGYKTAYAFWPPFHRVHEYHEKRIHDNHNKNKYDNPICLLHNANGWGYGALIDVMRERFGLRIHGVGSPDGLINHREVSIRLSSALCMIHLKSSDAPGYAIYEALAAACPIICTRRLIWRCRMEELLIPGETCLVFDRETHDGLTAEDVVNCTNEVAQHIKTLSNIDENRRIGEAGCAKLKELMWSATKDALALVDFFKRNFK